MKTLARMIVPALPIVLLLTSPAAATSAENRSYLVEGPEFWFDGPVEVWPADAEEPDVAVDGSGRTLVVWSGFDADGGDRLDIFLRRFAPDGSPLSDPVFVNTVVDSEQTRPHIAVATDDSFLVVWESLEADGAGTHWRVKCRAFGADGNPVSSEELVSTLSTNENVDLESDVAALTGGGYVVVWHSWISNGTDQSNRSVQARLIGANGTPSAPQFQCNTATGGQQHRPAVTQLPDGGFFAVWSDQGLVGRRFDASGDGVGNESTISTTPAFSQRSPDVALGDNDQVAVVWVDDSDGNSIRARLLDESLTPLGPGFRVNGLNDLDQEHPRVAALEAGSGFFVVWRSETSVDDNSGLSVHGRAITGAGLFAGPQFQLNQYTAGHQWQPAVGASGSRIVIAFHSAGYDSFLGQVVSGRQFEHCIFCDGFESGDTTLWSLTVP